MQILDCDTFVCILMLKFRHIEYVYPEKFFEVKDSEIEAFRKVKGDREKANA